MASVFSVILNMSITASIVIVLVILTRLCIRRLPKIYSYVLWSVVLFRLLCPVSIILPVSILAPLSGSSSQSSAATSVMEYVYIPQDVFTPQESSDAGDNITVEPDYMKLSDSDDEKTVTSAAEIIMPEFKPDSSGNDIHDSAPASKGGLALAVCGWIWITGAAALLSVTVYQHIRLKKTLATAWILRGNIYESEDISTAFVLGIFNPKIYLPMGLPFDVQKAVLLHEQTHQARGDNIIKAISYMALVTHWFNPLVWLAYKLSCDDMEKSCDEAVLRGMTKRGYDMKSVKYEYGKMLVALGSGQWNLFSPVSFAENETKERVLNVAKYKKPAVKSAAVMCLVCTIILMTGFVNPGMSRRPEDTGAESPYTRYRADSMMFKQNIYDLSEYYLDYYSVKDKNHSRNAHQFIICESEYWTDDEIIVIDGYMSQEDCDLSPLLECNNLKWLFITNMDKDGQASEPVSIVEDFSPLGQIPTLEGLVLENTGIKDLSVLLPLKKLKCLTVDNGPFDEPDFSSVAQMDSLRELSITCHDMGVIAGALDNMSSLEMLGISAAGYWDYEDSPAGSFPRGLTGLKYLSLSECYFYDWSGLNDCRNLSGIDIYTTEAFQNVSRLKGMDKLEHLGYTGFGLEYVPERDREAIESLSSLRELKIEDSALSEDYRLDCDGFASLTGMKNLKVFEYQYSENGAEKTYTGLRGLTSLEELKLYTGSVSPDVFYGCGKTLRRLECACSSQEQLEYISGLSSLETLTITLPQGEDNVFDVEGLDNLSELHIYAGGKSLEMNCGLPSLKVLTVNEIDYISSLGNIPSLEKLTIGNYHGNDPNLRNLDFVRGLERLEYLDVGFCGVNDISGLSGLNSLLYANLNSNNISDLSPLYNLERFRTGGVGSRYSEESPDRPYVDLSGNPISDEQVLELRRHYNENATIHWSETENN